MSWVDRLNTTIDKCIDDAVAQERARGNNARVRAAGMAALLAEIRAHNAARDLDDDMRDRIDRAIADHERAIDAHFASLASSSETGQQENGNA
jgi:hypothetical protein